MYLLVNLEGHTASMANIIDELVNKYSVPVSIVDSIDRACPNCKGGTMVPPKDPELPPISPATTTEIIDVKPGRDLYHENQVGRRTAAKQSAVVRIIEKKIETEDTKTFSDIQQLLEQVGCSRERESSPSHSHTPTTEGINSPMDSSNEAEENSIPSVDDLASFESMHPTLLACLISSTPNVFGHEDRSSPNEDTPPNLTAEGVFKTEDSSSHHGRILGQLISSSGKLRRGRIVYNSRDLDILESFYSKDPNACADPVKKQQMMEMLGVDAIRLKVWFQNRRRKDKIRSQKENS